MNEFVAGILSGVVISLIVIIIYEYVMSYFENKK